MAKEMTNAITPQRWEQITHGKWMLWKIKVKRESISVPTYVG